MLAAAMTQLLALAAMAPPAGTGPSVSAQTILELGVVLFGLERYAEARDQFTEAARIRDTIFPDGHPSIHIGRRWLALSQLHAGDYPAAAREFGTALPESSPAAGVHSRPGTESNGQ